MEGGASSLEESAELSSVVYKRSQSLSLKSEVQSLTYRPKPSFGTDNTSLSSYLSSSPWTTDSSSGYNSASSTASSFRSCKTNGNGYYSSPSPSIGGISSNSSPSMKSLGGKSCNSSPSMKGSISSPITRDDRSNPISLSRRTSSCDTLVGSGKPMSRRTSSCDTLGGSGKPMSRRTSSCEAAVGLGRRTSSWASFLESPENLPEAVEKRHLIDMSQLFLGQKFACGAYSRLHRGEYNEKQVAVKFVRQPEDDEVIAERLDRQFVQEVSLMSRLHHKNIVEFVGAIRKPPVFCIVTEYLEAGSLRAFLQKDHPHSLPIDVVLALALDIARGMDYLHSQGVLHLDLKSQNLVMSKDNCVKITDFGVARLRSECESMTHDCGTYRWMAPEMISNKTASLKADVYSFGVILWEILTGKTPYEEMTTVQAAFAVVDKNLRPPIPEDCPAPLSELIMECWAAEPEKRPHFWQIVETLEKFQDCVVHHESLGPQFVCKKKKGLVPLLHKLIHVVHKHV